MRTILQENSPQGKDGKRKTRKTGKKQEQSVEEIFASVSNIQASGLNPPPAKTVLTPRSAESCLKHGINPEVLRIRDLESFFDPNIDPAIQRMRHEAYSQRRHEMMQLVRTERKKIINAEMKAEAMGGNAGGASITPGALMAQQAKANATFVEEEEKRMMKMRRRQEKEIEQMLQFELKMNEIQEERDRRAAIDHQREEKRKREKAKRDKMVAEERRLKELRKKAMEDAEEEMRQEQAREMFRKEEELQIKRRAAEKAQKIEARQKEEERLRKQEEHRQQTQRILAEQQAAIKARMMEMEKLEQERQKRIAAELAEEKRRVAARRAAIEERITRNMKMAQKIEDKRKDDFYAKQEHHEQLRREHLGAQARDRELQARQTELMEQRRLMVLAQTRRDEERRKEDLVRSFADEEVNIKRVREARERNQMLIKEKKDLRTAMKLENVNRIKRIQEYRRLETLRRIHEGDKRITSMLARKQDIVDTRKQNALKVKIQKDNLVRVMDEAKAKGTSAAKMIKTIMAPPKEKKKKPKRIKGAQSMPAMGECFVRSCTVDATSFVARSLVISNSPMFASLAPYLFRCLARLPIAVGGPSAPLGPKPTNESLEERFNDNTPQPLPYVSPYEMSADPSAGQEATTVTF